MHHFFSIICQYFGVDYKKIRAFLPYLLTLSLIHFLPFWGNAIPYLDDLAWGIRGEGNQEKLGRYLGEYLFSISNFNFDFAHNRIIDSGCFLQIISILILSTVLCIFYLNINDIKPRLYSAIIIFIFLACPFFLDIFAYRLYVLHTSIGISLALLASLNAKTNRLINILVGNCLLLLMLNIYQVSINIYCAATIFIFLVEFRKNIQASLNFLLNNILKIIPPLLIYKLAILNPLDLNHYAKSRSSFLEIDSSFLGHVFSNIKASTSFIKVLFTEFSFIGFLAITAIIAFAITYISQRKEHQLKSALVFIACTCLIYLCSIGMFCFIKNTHLMPRYFQGISVFFLFIYYAFDQSMAKKFPSSKILLLIPIIYFCFISHSHAYALKTIHEYNYAQGRHIIQELYNHGFKRKDKVATVGKFIHSATNRQTRKQKLLDTLMIKSGGIGQFWFSLIFMPYLGLDAPITPLKEKLACQSKLLSTNPDFKIAKYKDTFVVILPNSRCYNTVQ